MKSSNKLYIAIPILSLVIILTFMLARSPSRDIPPALSDVNNSIPVQESAQHASSGIKAELKATIANQETSDNVDTSPPKPDTSIESMDKKRERVISDALRAVDSNDVEARLYGIQALAFFDPGLAVAEIYKALVRMESQPDVEGMIVLGALKLAHDETYFGNEVILDIYESTDSDNIKGRLARILSFRGDDSVLVDYLSDIKPKLTKSETPEKADMLLMLGSVESKLAIPYIKPYLSDPDEGVRIAALTALGFSANEDELEMVKPMQFDQSEHVRNNANLVVNYLTAKGKSLPLPAEISATWNEDDNYF